MILILLCFGALANAQWPVQDPYSSPQMPPPKLNFGDMLMTPKQQDALKQGKDMSGGNAFAAETDVNLRWKDAVIPYKIDCSIENLDDAVEATMKAMQEWENKTCIRFVKHTNEKYFLNLFRNTHCWGNIGQTSYTSISIGYGCEYQHVMTHEIGHVVGFYHEQNRKDRDDWVKVHWENIGQFKDAFDIVKNTNSMGVPYDYESIMHYPWNAFSSNGKDTMTPIKDTKGKVPYIELSKADILQTSRMYNCPAVERKRKAARAKRHSGEIGNEKSDMKDKRDVNDVCIDENKYCPDWAKMGYCSNDPYTQQHCKLSCRSPSCISNVKCVNNDALCPEWAKWGHCQLNPYVMKECQASCNPTCNGGVTPTMGPQTRPPTQPPTAPPTDVKRTYLGKGILCVDSHPNCANWAKQGQCESNPGWMMKSCMISCKSTTCDPVGLKPAGTCANPLGLSWDGTSNFKIPDSAFYSPDNLSPGSNWQAAAKNARLYFQDDHDKKRIGAWCSASHDQAKSKDGYVQVDLGQRKTIRYIATQGRHKYFERIGKFKIQYGDNGSTFNTYQENGQDKVFDGNCDHMTPVLNKFTNQIKARYLRYIPIEWNFPCVRMEFYGC